MLKLAYLALAGFALPLALAAQGIPDELKDKAFIVSVIAVLPAEATDSAASPSGLGGGARATSWQASSSKYTVPGTPVPFKLVGSNVVVVVQITPYENGGGKGLTLIAQGQVWVKLGEGGLSYHTTVNTLSIELGETVLFFPLGLGAEGRAPMRLEISVSRASAGSQDGGGAADRAGK